MLNTMRRHGIILALFAALTTGLAAVINLLTESKIAQQSARQQKARLDAVIPVDIYNNDLQAECYIVINPELGNNVPHQLWLARMNGKPVAAAVETTAPNGYAGAIQLLIGANFNGKVLGTRVTEHHETPGLGDKIEARISGWINQFSGKQITEDNARQWAVKKDGGVFDQFTGATITPRAVVDAVKRTTSWLKNTPTLLSDLQSCGNHP